MIATGSPLSAIAKTDWLTAVSGPAVAGMLRTNPPTGCAFHPRCAFATDLCRTDAPPTREYSGHSVVCHYDLEAI